MPETDEPRDDRPPIVGEHLSSTDVARLNEALKALPAEIAESLRSAPLGVREVRSRWLRWLAVAGVVVAIGSGIYTLVAALTAPSVVREVAPISRTAERIDRGLTGVEAAVDRARARYRAARERVVPEQPAPGAGATRREFSIGGGAFGITVTRDPDPEAEDGPLRGWSARIAPGG